MSNLNSKIAERIAKLFERADHPNTPEAEAAACREKAESIMRENRISQAMLHLTDEQKRVFEQYVVPSAWGEMDWGTRHQIAVVAFEHAGCRVKTLYGANEMLHVVGYPADVFYGKVLFERAIAELRETLDPQWKDNMTDEQNIFRLKNSGMTWAEVAGKFTEVTGRETTGQSMLYRYKKWAKLVGHEEVQQTRRHGAYRNSLQEAFSSTLYRRLDDLRRSAQGDEEPGEYAIAIVKDEDALREEFYNLFPEMRPKSAEERKAARESYLSKVAEETKAEEERRAKLTDAQRAKEDRARAREEARSEREYQAYRERNRKDAAGWAVGHRAAKRVRVSLNDEMKGGRTSVEA